MGVGEREGSRGHKGVTTRGGGRRGNKERVSQGVRKRFGATLADAPCEIELAFNVLESCVPSHASHFV